MITGPSDTIMRARKLRSEMSLPEALLWRELRQRPGDFKFRRQHAAGNYVLDFYCATARLAIEVDGWAHDNPEIARRDTNRSAFLRSQGVATTRIAARMILEDIAPVVTRIVEIYRQRTEQTMVPLHQPRNKSGTGPPPRPGEEL